MQKIPGKNKIPELKNQPNEDKTKAEYLVLKKSINFGNLAQLWLRLGVSKHESRISILNENKFLNNTEFRGATTYLERKNKYKKTLSGNQLKTRFESKLDTCTANIVTMSELISRLMSKQNPNPVQMRKIINTIARARKKMESVKLSMPDITESLKIQAYCNDQTGTAIKDEVINKFKERFAGYNLNGLKGYDKKKAGAVNALILARITKFFDIKGKKGATLETFVDGLPELTSELKIDFDSLYDDPEFYDYVVKYVIKNNDYLKAFEGNYFGSTPTSKSLKKEPKGKDSLPTKISLEGLLGKFSISKARIKPKAKSQKTALNPALKTPIIGELKTPTINTGEGQGAKTRSGSEEGRDEEGGSEEGRGEKPQIGFKNPTYVKWKLAQLDKAQKIMSGTANEAVKVLMAVSPNSRLAKINYEVRKQENGDYRAESIKAEALRLYENENNNPDGPDENAEDKYDAIYKGFNVTTNLGIEKDRENGDLPKISSDADRSELDAGEYDEFF